MHTLISYHDGIHTIDALYTRPRLAAIHLIIESGRAAIFDTGTNASLPQVLDALKQLGVTHDAVEYVIPSHVHLDHAGGSGAMMQAFPRARLVVHPRGARHLADPAKLIAGTVAVYGAKATRALYGDIVPVPGERIVEASDGMTLDLAGRRLTLIDTPGHARHHVCLIDGRTGSIFAGDMFGLSYRELDVGDRQAIFPTTTPVQFDPAAMHASIDRLLELSPPAIYLTHYSQVRDVYRLGADLHRLIDAHCDAARGVAGSADRHRDLVDALTTLLREESIRQQWRLGDAELLDLFANDLDLNAQGLEVWLDSMP